MPCLRSISEQPCQYGDLAIHHMRQRLLMSRRGWLGLKYVNMRPQHGTVQLFGPALRGFTS